MIYIKCTIFILIFSISTAIGIMISKKYTNRVRDLRELKNVLTVFKSKMKFTYNTIPEIFKEISEMTHAEISNLFKNAYENMEKENAGKAWIKAVEKNNASINKEDKEILKGLSKLLGKTDIEGQTNEIDLTLSFLDTQIEKSEKEKIKNEKLYQTLGAVVGLVIIIILI